ncbi:TetR family transcriptional regulator [Saccharopolyspora sp. 7B]|uniref:TetR family transcriptional regulator n=1 Tax=Saccharopolyspora sp. 7B TaxID=2877240 RepID=UPI001CD3519E|nr:TetR family transcriptional regulator [Saccharopolyspora sp. 7B]MCA1283388.1 TetR family transcriptional regulator [Saccharopolyspora sp. 7B]
MSEQPRPRAGRTPQGRRRIRGTVSSAALDLFAANGFEATTVDQIAEAAGVGRRTFFRYFRSKEDAVFGDHEERLADVAELLEQADGEEPLPAVCRAAEAVLETYLADPAVSLQRFALTRQVPSLRAKEIASTDDYQRAFTRYLRGRYDGEPDAALRAAVAAAAVVAPHNQVLREWLKSGAELDARGRLHAALAGVRGMAATWPGTLGAALDDRVGSAPA